METMILPRPRACLSVDLARLCHNYRYLAALLARDNTEPIAVVKANAYGHGAIPIAAALYGAGCRRFAVADLCEALPLRAALPPCEILVLGYTPPENARLAADGSVTLTVVDEPHARALSRALGDTVLSVAVKLNCGMNRMGLRLAPDAFDRSVEAILGILRMPRLFVTSIYSHLATADAPAAPETRHAVRLFFAARSALARRGVSLPMHLSASAAVLSRVAVGLPLARLGLALYGYDPLQNDKYLLPIAELSAHIAQIYPIARGECVGYGAAFRAAKRDLVGILPIGYADGLCRAASCGGYALVAGHRAPLIGRISMDAAAISLRGIPRADCRCAVLFGKSPSDLFALAEAAKTIPYELLAGLGQRIDRKYKYGNDLGNCDTE